MARSKSHHEEDLPASPAFLLPPLRMSRRSSLTSLSSTNPLDKETVALALDQIHSTASQSDTLTTFNEYAAPPPPASNSDNRSVAGDLQGGITGLYNRFRASVSNPRESIPGRQSEAREGCPTEGPEASLQGSSSTTPFNRHQKSISESSGRADIFAKQYNKDTEKEGEIPSLKGHPSNSKALLVKADDRASPLENVSVSPGLSNISERQITTKDIRPSDGVVGSSTRVKALRSKSPVIESDTHMQRVQPLASPEVQASENQEVKTQASSTEFRQHELSRKANQQSQPGTYQHLEIPIHSQPSRTSSPSGALSRALSREIVGEGVTPSTRSSSVDHKMDQTLSGQTATLGNLSLGTSDIPEGQDRRIASVFAQAKSKVLSKDYWMKDENAKDCFGCGDAFSTFRRKHHCRTCGQIFDAKCTTVISGEYFKQPGTLRVCKPCEGIIKGEDDSSDLSDDGSYYLPGIRPRHGSNGAADVLASPFPDGSLSYSDSVHPVVDHDLGVPVMSIPATRKAGEKARKSAVVEIGSERILARPSSSRSLKSAFGSRPHAGSHRRHNSRNQFPRLLKATHEDSAPFHQDAGDRKSGLRLGTFHDDNIIDPDLAPYLSDDQSSGDEQVSLMAALNGDEMTGSYEERHGWDAATMSSRKARLRFGEKSVSSVTFAGKDSDAQSLTGSRTPRPGKRRTFSTSSQTHLRPSPRGYRAAAVNFGSTSSLRDHAWSLPPIQAIPPENVGEACRMLRSSSMRGAAAPRIELNQASVQHVRKLLHQLLVDGGLYDVLEWEKALLPILFRATDDVNPDVQNGDDMDIRHYVKLKKIPGGRPGDTAYVSGLVFTKNLALKSMPRTISHPNILILTFPLEYARHQQHFMSLEPVIRQEREFLQNVVNRIAALRPQLLLVERHVSGLALEFLEQANIATAYNVKASVLEAVSRCCQTRIISSIDKLAIRPAQAGKCANFHLKTYLHHGRKKTYVFLSGTSKELGCTIVLRGAENAILKKIKNITEFMVYVVYNLKLETCLMKDELALIPSDIENGSSSPGLEMTFEPETRATSDIGPPQRTNQGLEDKAQNGRDIPDLNPIRARNEAYSKPSLPDEDSVPDDIPMPTFYTNMVEEHRTKILSASPFVKFMQPYLLMRAREQERRLDYLKRLRDQDILEIQSSEGKAKTERFDLITSEMVHQRVPNASKKVREVLYAVHDAEYDKALYNYQTQSKQWETNIAGNIDMFNPYAHQNIALLYSVVCTSTTIPCSGPDLVALSFYNEHEIDADFEADCTLGQYVEDLCIGASAHCTANGCEKQMIEHHRQYVHGEAQVSVFIEQYSCKLAGFSDTILMWNICRKCGTETEVKHMSENTWKYSFGKYLELCFWSTDIQAQAETCTHDLHRDFLHYFGFKDLAVRVHFDSIKLLEIIVPRARITWKVDHDLRFRNDVFVKIEARLNKYMGSVKARVKSISVDSVLPEKAENCKLEVERLGKKANDDHGVLLAKLRERYMSSKHYEVIPLNQAIRSLQEKVVEWDNTFNDFDRNFFPSEKDIRRLTTLQLKKMFLDREESSHSLASDNAEHIAGNIDEKEAMSQKDSHARPDAHPSTEKSTMTGTQGLRTEAEEDGTLMLSSVPDQMLSELVPKNVDSLDLATHADQLERSSAEIALLPNLPMPNSTTSHNDKTPHMYDVRSTTNFNADHDSRSEASAVGDTQEAEDSAVSVQPSAIPRPVGGSNGPPSSRKSAPALNRAQTQPVILRDNVQRAMIMNGDPMGIRLPETLEKERSIKVNVTKSNRSVPDRLGLHTLKTASLSAQSLIPLAINSRRRDTRVSNLARHFEQLSREFEKERLKERKEKAIQSRQSRAHPLRASKPIVQIYRNFSEAVEEKVPSDEDLFSSDPSTVEDERLRDMEQKEAAESTSSDHLTSANTEVEDFAHGDDQSATNAEHDSIRSDDEIDLRQSLELPVETDESIDSESKEEKLDFKLDLPKHEKTSLMKILTNFWAERSASGWEPLAYPLHATDHIFADSDIIVREDEPSSLIAFALNSEDYRKKLAATVASAGMTVPKKASPSEPVQQTEPKPKDEIEATILRPTGTHLKYQFSEGSAKMLCKIFYAEQFDALRRKCGVEDRIVESLSRCMKWDSKGGKTNSVFLKSLDDRFVLKSLSPIETQAFLRFAPAYFRIISESLFHDMPSVIAKMLGFYQIVIKNPMTGVEFNWFVLVMENLFYDRSPDRIFDLKGSMRNRRIQSTGEQNEVLLDENMVEFIYESPLFSREHSKKLLRASVWNDTLFLSRQNVMDYSLMIAIDETKNELVVGIIDCIRTYTWDKKLESWIKDRGKNRPTVTSPKEYKSRFREAMNRYVLQAPNCWHQFKAQLLERLPQHPHDDPGDDKEAHVLDIA